MKKISFWLNIVLLVAVAVLFFLHFQTSDEKISKESEKTQTEKQQQKEFESYDNLRVAYVNIDTLLSGYDMYTDKREEFIEEQTSSKQELESRSQQLQKKFKELKEKLNKGLITRSKARMMQRDLGQKEQKLRQLQQQKSSELAEREQIIYRQVLNSVMDYLEIYAEEKNYHYILSYSFGGPILYKKEAFNVTQSVLKGLNERYDEKQVNEN